jgi:acyl-CoA synthetase (AMP-forming)/AMP-acid ligase II
VRLPDDKWGKRVTAVVQAHPGQDVPADDLRAFVRERLGGVRASRHVEVWPDLPRSRVGKVRKNEVRSQLLGPAPGDTR